MGAVHSEEYERIDRIRSVTAMRKALASLEPTFRKQVVLTALGSSRHQFTWSFFAGRFEVPEAEWPPQPEHL